MQIGFDQVASVHPDVSAPCRICHSVYVKFALLDFESSVLCLRCSGAVLQERGAGPSPQQEGIGGRPVGGSATCCGWFTRRQTSATESSCTTGGTGGTSCEIGKPFCGHTHGHMIWPLHLSCHLAATLQRPPIQRPLQRPPIQRPPIQRTPQPLRPRQPPLQGCAHSNYLRMRPPVVKEAGSLQ